MIEKQAKRIKAALLEMNHGQVDWLPRNPRTWTRTDVEDTAASIKEDPDFLEDRPLLVVPHGKRFVVFAGNLRLTAAEELKLVELPCVIYVPHEDDPDYTTEYRATVLRRAMKDNGSFGKTDWQEIHSSPWALLPLEKWGLGRGEWPGEKKGGNQDPGQQDWEENGLSSQDGEADDEYGEFVDKFKQKLTTDDCYTPPAVYDAVCDFVDQYVRPLEGLKVVRPFFPGGDYTRADQYGPGSIVIDNPPFSILSEIIRFYCKNGTPFFLFAPALTLFSAPDCDVTYIVSDSEIEYENGARVRTGFITNLIAGLRIWVCPSLKQMTDAAQADGDKTKQGFVYPDNIVTAAILGKIAKRSIELKIAKRSCEYRRESDSAKEQGRALYGGGFIMSDRAAAERAAAERAAATRLNISPRERAIIERLNEQDKD